MAARLGIVAGLTTVFLAACAAPEPARQVAPAGTTTGAVTGQTNNAGRSADTVPEGAEFAVPAPSGTDGAAVPEEPPPEGAERQFSTDFAPHRVPYSEIRSGGPSKDGIPAIDDPQFVSVHEADEWMAPKEPVVLLENEDEARAYPLQILIWHELVNDTFGELSVVVSFCPLCNTAIAFDRQLDGMVLDFGTTGRLRYSNLVMYERQTESWWQQATGTAAAFTRRLDGRTLSFSFEDGKIVDDHAGSEWSFAGEALDGALEGRRLQPLVAVNHFWFSWAAFRPETKVYELP